MSYQVLARKWRPRTFTEVVGQEHVVKALTNALEFDRMHHAYLFAGTRGVGKTTLARILAKAINCEARRGFDPCGECDICRAVDEGHFVDLIEVDAASRTKVEDTRELLENVVYAPSRGRFKVYLIDEVHMLSGHSFNALLKTLEEPPAHVKFLLATTDPQKVPVTVLSRCLQLSLKRLPPGQIRAHMEKILNREGIAFDDGALRALARAADGSLRDGLSLLDQAIVHGGGRVGEVEVNAMLGCIAAEPVLALLDALGENDGRAILHQVDSISALGADFAEVLSQLLSLLHRIALVQVVPDTAENAVDAESIRSLAAKMSAEQVQLYYQIGLIGQRDLPLAPDPRSGFEMVLLRMLAFRPVQAEADEPGKGSAGASLRRQAAGGAQQAAFTQPAVTAMPAENPPSEVETCRAASMASPKDWLNIVEAMKINGMAKELAIHCSPQGLDDATCTLLLDPQHAQLRTQRITERLEKSLRDYYHRDLKLLIRVADAARETPAALLKQRADERQKAAERAIEQDENIQALKEAFDARIIPGTIEPLDSD